MSDLPLAQRLALPLAVRDERPWQAAEEREEGEEGEVDLF